jgi:hypothetical protein
MNIRFYTLQPAKVAAGKGTPTEPPEPLLPTQGQSWMSTCHTLSWSGHWTSLGMRRVRCSVTEAMPAFVPPPNAPGPEEVVSQLIMASRF